MKKLCFTNHAGVNTARRLQFWYSNDDSQPGRKKKKKEVLPPVVGPYVHILHIADNAIDVYGEGRDNQLFPCFEVLKQIIMYSPNFVELDMDDNAIGDRAAKQLLHALDERKLANYPGIKVRTTAQMEQSTYSTIAKFAAGMKKKKKKGKKKKKKVDVETIPPNVNLASIATKGWNQFLFELPKASKHAEEASQGDRKSKPYRNLTMSPNLKTLGS